MGRGHNHPLGCTCGWCTSRWGNGRGGATTSSASSRAESQPMDCYRRFGISPIRPCYESYTIPNARCPVCGATVFFYQSPNGGRVFFDELGPPWPKHPCTSRGGVKGKRYSPTLVGDRNPHEVVKHFQWQKEGWQPLFRMYIKNLACIKFMASLGM